MEENFKFDSQGDIYYKGRKTKYNIIKHEYPNQEEFKQIFILVKDGQQITMPMRDLYKVRQAAREKILADEQKSKVFVVEVANSDGVCRPEVFDSLEKAQQALQEIYYQTIENIKICCEEDEETDMDYSANINLIEGWFYVTDHIAGNCVSAEIYEEEIK